MPASLRLLLIRCLELLMPRRVWQVLRFECSLVLLRLTNRLSPFQGSRIRSYRQRKHLLIHLASGSYYLPGWVNIDGLSRDPADLRLDLRTALPLPSHCARFILCEHFLEHLEYPGEALLFLQECRRLLEPGGILRLSVPDAEKYLVAYYEKDRAFFERERPGCSPMEAVNNMFRQGQEHQYAYDGNTLSALLTRAGFGIVEQRAFNRSRWEEFHADFPARQGESLYVEAVS